MPTALTPVTSHPSRPSSLGHRETQALPGFPAQRGGGGDKQRLSIAFPATLLPAAPGRTSHQNSEVTDHGWVPCLWSSPVLLRVTGNKTRSSSPLYPPVSEMLLTHPPDHGSWNTLPVWQTEDQPKEPASELTWWGEGGKSREVEVQKGGVWPDLQGRNSSLLGQDPLKFRLSLLFAGPPDDWRKPKTSGNLPGVPPQSPHP